jgi:hypothetical protein
LDDGKIYRKALYLMVKTMVSCRFSLKPIHWIWGHASISCWWNGPGQIRLTGWIHLIKAWSAGEKKKPVASNKNVIIYRIICHTPPKRLNSFLFSS